ncbi:aromatic ring-hydroxylating oxygenase subunit alpha [Corallococcus carmarthensis]|uniref:Aromatic ring-hydroxylating dioxygenase subunit alpha n=1 Tax=Corallococcus carmarthensis TaxID=2316728 RepID=A0A3A8JW57_9BACT|nr:aromatic ring-hydroxylating dioxygenase subunit alpha [Corallococcus carmarthensis]NOK18523.1 aromatic ring-hydroxylating dioxygenase subunit alpha [Corallococcus carmarthensis]RKG99465.1 aromatic ring-hydroxylating dioxygenase subunit alpha [Corallococcus carmarthensis]
MERPQQLDVVKRLHRLIEGRTTDLAPQPFERDASAYDDPARFEHEKDLFFRRTPLWAGFSSDLKQPGDFITHDDSGVPILIVRQEDGTLGAYMNICRHRGTRVVLETRGSGHDCFRCPYHGWTYGRNGRLMGIPFHQGFEGVDKGSRGLVSVPVAEKYGMVFVCATPGMHIDLDEHLGPLGPELESWGVGRTCRIHEKPLDSPVNWKFALDVFAEGYHFTVLHRDTIAMMTHNNVMTFDRIGRHYRLAFPSLDIGQLRSKPEHDWVPLDHLSFVYYIYPNISLNVTGAKVPTVRVFSIVPGQHVGHSVTHHKLYCADPVEAPAERERLLKHFDYMHRVVEDEDHSVAVRTQAALSARAQRTFVFGRNEPSLIHMHRQYDELLAEDAERQVPAEVRSRLHSGAR